LDLFERDFKPDSASLDQSKGSQRINTETRAPSPDLKRQNQGALAVKKTKWHEDYSRRPNMGCEAAR